jgi:acyl-CoA thioesterase-2
VFVSKKMPDVLRLVPIGAGTYSAPSEDRPQAARDVVFGGQILAQMIIASAMARDFTKEVKSIHTIFARPGSLSEPLIYEVESMQDGRTFGSDTVTCRQAGKIVARGLILLNVDEPNVISHVTVRPPDVPRPGPGVAVADARVVPGAEAVICGRIDSADQDAASAALAVWTRYPKGAESVLVHQAVLSWASDGYLIGAAMAPHPEYREDMAHHTVSTGVVSHTVNFHDRFDVAEWLLLAHEGVWAGRGRAFGRGNVFAGDGRLVATFTQDSMIRAFADGSHDHIASNRRL